MKKFLVAAVCGTLLASSAFASFTNVTIGDGRGGVNEDQELDVGGIPWNSSEQAWDVEGFFWNGADLALVGGYDFANGVYWGADLITGGDVFIDNDLDGFYDLAIDMDIAALTYDIYDVNASVVAPADNAFSSPFQVTSGIVINSGTLAYSSGLTDAAAFGLLGGSHNKVELLGLNTTALLTGGFDAHYTMRCGNDMTKAHVPEPTMMSLLGFGLLGVAFLRRRK